MRYIVTKETTLAQFDAMLEQLSKEKRPDILLENKKSVDWSVFCGKVNFKGDGLDIQNELRNEWDS